MLKNKRILKGYKDVEKEIEELEIPIKNKITALVLATLVSFLIVAGPILFCVNCFIFENFITLFAFLITLFACLFFFLTEYIYLHTICEKKVLGLYHIWAIDTTIASLVFLFIFMILTMIGVI